LLSRRITGAGTPRGSPERSEPTAVRRPRQYSLEAGAAIPRRRVRPAVTVLVPQSRHKENDQLGIRWKSGDAWLARLPDRLTHAAMLMLGAAVDHTMPGVAFTQGVEVQELPELAAVMFIPQQPNDRQRWAVSLSPGLSAFALDNAWRPEAAAAANLSGTTIIDVSDPSKAASAIEYARAQGAQHVTAWGTAESAADACSLAPLIDALLLTRPVYAPDAFIASATESWPATMIQHGIRDDVATRWEDAEKRATVREYMAEHHVLTPAVARQRIQDAAEFLRSA